MEIEIIVPEISDDVISTGLRSLTEILYDKGAEISGGVLGGEFGYGAFFENATFSMHPYCWCEEERCPWCADNAPNFLHKASGFRVNWYKYIGRGMETVPGELPWPYVLAECLASINASQHAAWP